MKKIRLVLAAAIMFSFVMSLPAKAQEEEDNPVSNEVTTMSETEGADDSVSTISDSVKKMRKNAKENLSDRLSQYKEELGSRLSTAQETRIKNRCKPAQNTLKTLSSRGNTVEQNRTKVYGVFAEKLNNVASRLEIAGETDLSNQVKGVATTAQEKIDAILAAIADYNQALADLSELDCQTDPTAFKAALENARDMRKAITEQTAGLHEYKTTTILPTLQSVRDALKNKTDGATEPAESDTPSETTN